MRAECWSDPYTRRGLGNVIPVHEQAVRGRLKAVMPSRQFDQGIVAAPADVLDYGGDLIVDAFGFAPPCSQERLQPFREAGLPAVEQDGHSA